MATTLVRPPSLADMQKLMKKPRLFPWEQKLRGVLPAPLPPALSWTTIAPPPRARWNSTAFAVGDSLWIVGGYYEDGSCADIDIYDFTTQAWSLRPNPFTYWQQAFALSGGILYAISGCQACWTLTPAVEAYDLTSGTLVTIAPLPQPCIMSATVVAANRKIYVLGGCTAPSDPSGPPDSYLDTVQVFDPLSMTWSQAGPMPVTRDSFAAVAAPDGRIYTFGGFNTANTYARTDVFDPATGSWQQRADMPTTRRCHAAAMTNDGFIHVIGGLIGTGVPTVETFDPSTNQWTTNSPLATGRWYAAVATVQNRICVAGGFIRVGPYQPDNANVFAVPSVEVTR